jgi:glycosyltransferase involved in cell wall biosynthesis/SAM-dependent methyltransferase
VEINDLDLPGAVIDTYIEHGASIEAIGASLRAVDPSTVRRFLDVGCNYGFGVHLAQELLGWDAEGIEPGNPGRRGAVELGIRVRGGYLTTSSEYEHLFDVALASEVLEHVDDPREFLEAVRSVLTTGGRLIITTPAAEVLDGSSSEADVIVALSPGFHRFLASARGLEHLLRSAGFAGVNVSRDGRALKAVASVGPVENLRWEDHPFPEDALLHYYAKTASLGEAGSALAIGMATRQFRALVNAGAFAEASKAFDRVASEMRLRYGVEVSDPTHMLAAIREGAVAPACLIPIAYHAAMLKLLSESDPLAALRFFDLVVAAARQLNTRSIVDGDSAELHLNALRHRALSLAMASPPAAAAALDALVEADSQEGASEWLLRVFVQLVNQGSLAESRVLSGDAGAAIDLVFSTDLRGSKKLAIDALLCLANLELQTGSPRAAIEHIERGLSTLEETPGTEIAPAQRESLHLDLNAQLGVARQLAEELRWVETSSEVQGGVSVIMPVFNGAQYLREAIASVASQDLQPLELIIVDDGSTDGSMRLVNHVQSEFPVIVVRQANEGQSSARNMGIRHARGEYLAFIDQDDIWRPDHLSRLVPYLQADPSCGWAFSDFEQIDAGGHTVTKAFIAEVGVVHPKRSLVSVLSQDLLVLPSASVIRRRTAVEANGFDTRLNGYEDDDLFVKVYRRGWGHAFDPSASIRYRVHARGASSTPAFLRSRLIFLNTLLSEIPDDHRLDFYLSHDVIIPRFYGATLRDYTDALAFRDWARAVTAVTALMEISRMLNRVTWRRKLMLRIMRHPRLLRAPLLIAERLPEWIRPQRMSTMYFGHRSVVRAGRFPGSEPHS